MQNTKGIMSVLNISGIYSLFRFLMAAKSGHKIIIDRYIKPFKNCNILDIGCGPCDILAYMPEYVNYYGFDLSKEYIDAARKKYGSRGHFFCSSVNDEIQLPDIKFDVAIMLGVLHHLSDEESKNILKFAHSKLERTGKLVTVDCCFMEQQHFISRFLIQHDRGKNVRTPQQYSRLAKSLFRVKGIHTNLCRVPYNHWIMECTARE